ncbi:hypothetical protein EKM01_03920 [Flavobacterium sp. RSP46]|uniref:hypothetical protein n=1 Tax=Flavobacterium sp. RSP46 TaxID=2497486 RepID=UPI000F87AEB9|nr:hypothetical protein [Flavobacterium sp. RSP46]RTY93257.1 hypothetical protein EKM01_03920 [Flavobacterium sp. RSP46]
MSAQIVLDHYLEKYQTLGNTMSDINFDNLSFFTAKEKVIDMKGQWVSKSYYAAKDKEAIRITYEKLYGTHTHNGVEWPNIFLGVGKSIHYLDWAGEIAYTKNKQPEYFDLQPVFVGDGTETVVGFSSQKQRQILKEERRSADDYLQAKNPNLYALLYARYTDTYEYYLKTGKKADLVTAINAETDPDINAVFNNLVFGTEITVRDLILMNLQ